MILSPWHFGQTVPTFVRGGAHPNAGACRHGFPFQAVIAKSVDERVPYGVRREGALERALITRYGTLGRVREPFMLCSDSVRVFTNNAYTWLVRSYGLKQELITHTAHSRTGW